MTKKPIYCYLLTVLFAASAQAATPPEAGAIRERTKDTLEYYEFQKRLEQAQDEDKDRESVVDETAAEPSKSQQSDKTIYVKKIVVGESDILTAEELQTIVAPYEKKEVSITELFSVVEKINQRYKDKKYLSAKAILPPQKVEDGIINIKLVEGRIGGVVLENNKNTDEGYITDRLEIDKGSLVRLDQLERELFYFNSTNDVKIRAVLKPGEEFATTDYILQVDEPRHYYTTLFLDNTGTDDTGSERLGVSFVNNSLTGKRDVFSAGANTTEGVQSLFVSYNRAVNKRGTRLGLSADYSSVKVIEGDLEPLNIDGGSHNFGVFVTHPFLVEKSYLVNLFAGINKKNSYTKFDRVKIVDTDVSTASLGVDSQHYGNKWVLYSRHVVTAGDSDVLGGSGIHFTTYRTDMSYVRSLENDFIALLRFSGQLSDAVLLPASEQFQIGGMSTVRGYPAGILSGDDGYFASYEVSFPVKENWRGLAFIDHGGAFPFKGNNAGTDSSDYITSIGGGLNISFSETVSARFALGIPLKTRDDGEDDPMLHFYLSYVPK